MIIYGMLGSLSVLLLTADSEPAELGPMMLACQGGGIAEVDTNSSAFAFDNSGNSLTITGRNGRLVEYQATVTVRLEAKEDDSTVRLPSLLLPAVRGGENGWFRIKNLNADDATISGKAAINLFNNPDFSINRYSGEITINAKQGNFFGQCSLIESADVERRF